MREPRAFGAVALANSYLDVDGLAALASNPGLVRGLHLDETNRIGWRAYVEGWLQIECGLMNSQLRKRYTAPFVDPVPSAVLGWLVAIMMPHLWERRGWDPSDKQAEKIIANEQLARQQIQQAADSEIGLFDLPLRQDTTDTGIVHGGPLGYSEASPWDWTDLQRQAVRR